MVQHRKIELLVHSSVFPNTHHARADGWLARAVNCTPSTDAVYTQHSTASRPHDFFFFLSLSFFLSNQTPLATRVRVRANDVWRIDRARTITDQLVSLFLCELFSHFGEAFHPFTCAGVFTLACDAHQNGARLSAARSPVQIDIVSCW